MFKTRITSIISAIVRTELKRCKQNLIYDGAGNYTREGIMIEFRCSVSDYSKNRLRGNNRTKRAYRHYVMLFCGNTTVFAVRNDHMTHFTKIPPKQWENTSNHDSCWASDGLAFINQAYFDMCKEVNPDVAPIELESDADIGFLSTLSKKVLITYKRMGGDDYKNELVEVKEVE